MPRGASAKREREYNELKREFKKDHRYKGREEEVAARIVNKQRAQYGETKGEKRKDRKGKSPDRDLPVKNYQHKTVDQVERALGKLSHQDLKEIQKYEKQHKNRKTLLQAIGDRMKDGDSAASSKDPKTGRKSQSKSRNGSSQTGSARSSKTKARAKTESGSKSSSGKSKSGRSKSSRNGSTAQGTKVTTDHDEIRRWAEERGAKPSAVIRTEKGDDPGIIRLDFPGYSGEGALEEISWDDWFEKFEEKKLALLHQEKTTGGKKSNFNKIISR